ncbi:MAG: hypothetical protein HFG69_11730 [Hungatella sp.]|jgi:hypothetical protein|nr:hypothetical protein [Hungatella sp.]
MDTVVQKDLPVGLKVIFMKGRSILVGVCLTEFMVFAFFELVKGEKLYLLCLCLLKQCGDSGCVFQRSVKIWDDGSGGQKLDAMGDCPFQIFY